MIRTGLLVAFLLIMAAAVVYVLDLCLTVLFNRLTIPDDVKKAIRALLAVCVFVVACFWVLSVFGILPVGWW